MSIGDALGYDSVNGYDPGRVEELRGLVESRMRILSQQPLADPISVFVKPEPHKRAKLDEGRLRLISAVSFVDTMVDRVIFGWLSDKVLTNVGQTPVMVGWSPVYGQWRAFRARFGKRILCVDKSSWDWTVQKWLIDACLRLIEHLAFGADEWLVALFRARFKLLFEQPTYIFRDGSTVQQADAGVMKSGCYLTIILNSLCQLLMHAVVAPEEPLPFALGDDTAQRPPEDTEGYIAKLNNLGAKCKPELLDDVEFAGFKMSQNSCVPAYRAKHLFRMEFVNHLGDYLRAMQMLYASDKPSLRLFQRIALNRSPENYLSDFVAESLLNGTRGDVGLFGRQTLSG